MRTLQHAMMTLMLAAVPAVAVGAMQPWSLAAEAQHGQAADTQHGHAADPQAHFDEVAGRLELTAAQREALAEPFDEAFAAMQELHRLHDVIAAELTDGQKEKLAQMIHEMLGASFSAQQHGQRHHGERRH